MNIVSSGAKSRAGTGASGRSPPFYALALGPLRELGIAVGLVAMATVARVVLGVLFPGLGVFSLYFPAVLVAALIGGWRSGLAAMALTGAIVLGFFIKPVVSVRLTDPASPGNLAMVAISAAPLVIVGDYVRKLLGRLRLSRDALANRNLQFDVLFGSMLEGYALCEAIWAEDGSLADYTVIEMNPALQRMLGVGPEAIGTRLSGSAGDWSAWLKLCGRVLTTGKPAGFERHDTATDRWHEARVTRVTENLMAQIFFDITERKKAEFRQAGLFDELNHRVSNNLTLVSSILYMKARATDNELVRDQLMKAEARVQSIAQVHRALYRGGRTDQVEFGGYLRDLCDSVRESMTNDDRIGVEVAAEPVMLPVDMAIPLGMVVNELLTNAIKYAYPDQYAGGSIRVRLAGLGEGLRLTVRDDGQGLNEEVENGSSGLGMKLVRSLVAQVNGELVVRRSPGTTFELTLSQISGP